MSTQRLFPASGLTIVELLVTLAILALLIAIGVPTFTSNDAKLKSEAWNLRASLYKARSISVRSFAANGTRITMTFNSGAGSYSADSGGINGSLRQGVSMNSSCASLTFDGMGRSQNCDVTLSAGGDSLLVRVNRAGKIWVE